MKALRIAASVMLVGLILSAAAIADGTTKTALTTVRIDAEETTFGDLATDALCKASATTIALAPAVIFKPGEIPPGTVSLQAVNSLLHNPHEKWSVLQLTGAQISAALERSVSFAPTPRTFFLQVSGLTVVYNPRAPRGRKIKTVRVGKKPLNETAKYQVAMPASLAEGASGYFTVFGKSPKIRTGTRGLAEVITGYVDGKGTVSYTGQGRIVVGG